MYSHIVTFLSIDIADQVFEFIITMPETDPYTQLKEAFITRTAVSDERRLDELFGDSKSATTPRPSSVVEVEVARLHIPAEITRQPALTLNIAGTTNNLAPEPRNAP
ncbi:unnamed protein product, partial [Echinostoma caproni]|uniref:DUF7041 domain-containing protein n=1 Tax=Echinostoma caproni TaxID=27848 RepID=A0A183A039_9TREM